MRLNPQTPKRRGASLVEAALVLPVFLALIVGTLDLSIGLFRWHVLSEAARQAARKAIVRGDLHTVPAEKWGPDDYGPVAATDSHRIAQQVQSSLAGVDPAEVTVEAEWLDGGNLEEQQVRVTLKHDYTPITAYVFGLTGTIPLSASSTMRITH